MLKDKANIYEKNLGGDVIFIKQGHEKIKLNLYEIVYLEALKDYTKIVTKNTSYCVLETLGNILNDPSFKSFTRVHRSYAVQKNFVQQIQSQKLILINDISIPIGRSFKDNISFID
jgi:DNA-binding LytR/AlgR family response regulator